MPIQLDELERLVGRRQVGPVPPFCVHCGYNLTGMISKCCPECGCPFIEKEWRQKAWDILQSVYDIKAANDWARWGAWIASGGIGLLLVWLLARGVCTSTVLLLLAMPAGLAGVFLGLGVFRIRHLPSWAWEGLAPPRDFTSAAVAIVLGAVVMAAVVLAF